MQTISEEIALGKKIIVRCDFDVPVEEGKITEKIRIEKSAQTLRFLRKANAQLFIISHLGRPESKNEKDSLKIVVPILEEILGERVGFQENLENQTSGPIVLLENLRFWPEEEKNDLEFAKKLRNFGEIYINEAFSVSHREHASIAALPTLLLSYAGLELAKEISELEKIFKNPVHPVLSIIGGAKIETKLPAITNLAKVSDKVLVGGKLMFEIGETKLPDNVIVAPDHIEEKDIGEQTLKVFGEEIAKAGMIVWNGPMGLFEDEKYALGTKKLAQKVAESPAYSIVGGGDTLAALNEEGLLSKVDFVSMAGGAMLEFLSGKQLPGLKVLGYY